MRMLMMIMRIILLIVISVIQWSSAVQLKKHQHTVINHINTNISNYVTHRQDFH